MLKPISNVQLFVLFTQVAIVYTDVSRCIHLYNVAARPLARPILRRSPTIINMHYELSKTTESDTPNYMFSSPNVGTPRVMNSFVFY